MPSIKIKNEGFLLNNKIVRILSGAIHYFRVVPPYWEDRLLKLKACGFNTVETYIPWNLHEPRPGQFIFDGMADVVSFVNLADRLGLLVILRPSPYICSEWDFGGLPSWLLNIHGMKLRCFNRPFLERVDSYYDILIPKLKPLLYTNGGPVIALQIENEYGSYGNDKRYLEYLKDGLINRGIDVPLFTSDGPEDQMLQGGTINGVLKTVNFGSNPSQAFFKLAEYQDGLPLMCMEFWNGWFDHWGEEHHIRDAGEVADVLDEVLAAGASVNFYMFHGGTNFGFYNGANHSDKYEPTVTSYDFNCLLDEAGDPTEKYFSVRRVIGKYETLPESPMPANKEKMDYGKVCLTQKAGLFENLINLSYPNMSTCPESMETYNQDYGFILYETNVTGPVEDGSLIIKEVHDRALVFQDEGYVGTIERWNRDSSPLKLNIPRSGARLRILVENMGRINYGPCLFDRKGITDSVMLNNKILFSWTVYTLPINNLSGLRFDKPDFGTGPSFYKGILKVHEYGDTFLYLDGWTKGAAYVNGFNLGRYWKIGPQKALYVPAPFLKEGDNEVVIFELHGMDKPEVFFKAVHSLG